MWTNRLVLGLLLIAFVALPGPLRAQDISTDPLDAPDGTYQLDPPHTRVVFMCSHFGISDYIGFVQGVTGTLNWVSATPENGSVSVEIDSSGAMTGLDSFDRDLDGPDWFDAANFPKITFKSTKVERTGPTTGVITGDLTVRGITKPITLDVTFNGGRPHPINTLAYAIGFVATGTAKRSDYQMTKLLRLGVGDDVKILIHAEFIRLPG